MTSLNILMKDPDWQFLRKKLLNKWMCRPDWCCMELRKYMGRYLNTSPNIKLKIVSTYLSSSGFRVGAINHPRITQLKTELYLEIKKRKNNNKWS
jgi:hypothetical protein